jgi:glycosyltransferase involved in cell wall biosynthesis
MKLVIVSRIFNEDDIVEAFVRHHARHAGQFIFLDDGSTDRTLEILRLLKEEGLPIHVVQMQSSTSDQAARSTWLYHYADENFAPDWVVFLDIDEFIDTTLANQTIIEYLKAVPSEVDYIRWMLINYVSSPDDDPLQPIVPRRLRWRNKLPTDVEKIAVRGGLAMHGVEIKSGQHGALCKSRPLTHMVETNVLLAHFPERSLWQKISKNMIGWLKVKANGPMAVATGESYHYRDLFERILYVPASVISNPNLITPALDKGHNHLHPFHYQGGILRYFIPVDPRMKAIQVITHYMEDLADQYGQLVEEVPEARAAMHAKYQERKVLF